MEHETACDRICNNIATLLIERGRPTKRAAFAAARATREIADALHHAAGAPDDKRWYYALTTLESFVTIYEPMTLPSPALTELRAFLDENGVTSARPREASRIAYALDGSTPT